MRRQFKKLISSVLMTALVLSMGSGIDFQSANAADTELHNPVVEMNTCDTVYFGNYWQEDTNGDGVADQKDEKTPIRWRILSQNGNDAYVMADQALDCKPYHEKDESVTWETSTLRKWLNGEFYNTAFTAEEQEAVLEQTLVNGDSEDYGTEGGADTVDRVYLPSYGDIQQEDYGFSSNNADGQARVCQPTAYARRQGAVNYWPKQTDWWLRSLGINADDASAVGRDGWVYRGSYVRSHKNAVRPALHLNLASPFVRQGEELEISQKCASWDLVELGTYAGTPITWRVLSVSGNDVFLLSDQLLADDRQYHETREDITWKDSNLRTWLNGEFYQEAFLEEEKAGIRFYLYDNENNPQYGTEGGEDTIDCITLLSLQDIVNPEYGFPAINCASPTRVAYDGAGSAGSWWLRSPGRDANIASGVADYGYGYNCSGIVSSDIYGVRPALHLDLSVHPLTKVGTVTATADGNEYQENVPKESEVTEKPVATKLPEATRMPYIDKDLWNKKGIHAYISYQTTTWDYRNSYIPKKVGKNTTYDYIQASGAEIDGKEAKVTDVYIDQDNARYTATIEGIDLSGAVEGFNMLGIATDLDSTIYAGVTVKDVTIKFDGQEVPMDGDLVKKPNEDYYYFMAINNYAREGDAVHYPLQAANKAGKFNMPANSIEITFTINGIGKALDDIADGSYIDPETGELIGGTVVSSPRPTKLPGATRTPYIDKDLWAKKGIHAYISYQTTTWDYRSSYEPKKVGKNMTYDYILASGAEIDGREAKVTDVYIDQDNARYTATIEGIDLSGAAEGFNMLGIATDLDRTMYAGVAVKDVTIKFDGKEVPVDGDLVKNPYDDFYYFMAINKWDRDGDTQGGTVHYPLQAANEASNLEMPTNSIEITFTISGIGKALEDIVAGTYIDPETGKPIGGGLHVSSPSPSNRPGIETTPEPPISSEIPEPTASLMPTVVPTTDPDTQPDRGDLTDDFSDQDLKVYGLDIATDNIVKKGFLTVPRVQLTWDKNRNCDGYEIWKREGNKSFVKVDYIDDSDETEWFDTNLKKGHKYTYKVHGYVEEDDGTISRAKEGNSVSVKIRQTIKSCTYTAKRTGKKLKITFKKAEGTKYQIQVKYGSSKKWKKASGSLKKKIVKSVSPKKLKVRVRTCEKVNGKMKYSKWSKVKTVR